MSTSDIYKITPPESTMPVLSAAPPPKFLAMLPTQAQSPLAVVPGDLTPNYSPVIGPGGSTGGGWPFQDFNMMNDPEGNMAALPAIFVDGTGGPAGDPDAYLPNTNDFAAAGYGNGGAGTSAAQGINMVLDTPSYIAGATDLNNNNLVGAYAVGFATLTQESAEMPWTEIVADASPNIGKGVAELAGSSGVLCGGALALGNASLQIAAKVIAITTVVAPEVAPVVSAYEAAQLFVAGAAIINKCGLAIFGPSIDPDEAYVLGLIYNNMFKGYEHRPTGGVGVDGGDGIKGFQGGGAPFVNVTAGMGVNYLTSACDGQTGTTIALHNL